jgi:hypothetical protein
MAEEPNVSLKGSTLYRAAFLIFIAGCLFNAFDSYVSSTLYYWQRPNEEGRHYETWMYLILSVILAIECAGLLMFKRLKMHLKKLNAE